MAIVFVVRPMHRKGTFGAHVAAKLFDRILCDRMCANHGLGIGMTSHPEDDSRTPRIACKQLRARVANDLPIAWLQISISFS